MYLSVCIVGTFRLLQINGKKRRYLEARTLHASLSAKSWARKTNKQKCCCIEGLAWTCTSWTKRTKTITLFRGQLRQFVTTATPTGSVQCEVTNILTNLSFPWCPVRHSRRHNQFFPPPRTTNCDSVDTCYPHSYLCATRNEDKDKNWNLRRGCRGVFYGFLAYWLAQT